LISQALSVEEARERQNRLAKMRALLFYHEAKARRLKKIKSKEYRRKLKKAGGRGGHTRVVW
jgi:U3 small nucleolar RNA-associated protein 14